MAVSVLIVLLYFENEWQCQMRIDLASNRRPTGMNLIQADIMNEHPACTEIQNKFISEFGWSFLFELALFDCLRQHCCKHTNSHAFIIVPWKGWPLPLPSGTPHSGVSAYWKAIQSAPESWTISQFMISQPFKGWFNICLRGSGKLPKSKREDKYKQNTKRESSVV